MAIMDVLRSEISKSGETHYSIGKATGVDARTLDRFISDGKNVNGDTLEALAEYFNLELVKKKQKKSAKQATRRRRKTVPPPKTRGAWTPSPAWGSRWSRRAATWRSRSAPGRSAARSSSAGRSSGAG